MTLDSRSRWLALVIVCLGDLMPVPVHQLATPEDFLAVLDGHPTKFAAGSAFSYCNGGYVVLALLAERASGVPYHDLVAKRVCEPAGMIAAHALRAVAVVARVRVVVHRPELVPGAVALAEHGDEHVPVVVEQRQ